MPTEYKDVAGSGGEIDAGIAVDPNGDDIGSVAPEPARKPGKRRGRPPGSRNSAGTGKAKTRNAVDLSSLTGLFVGVHCALSAHLSVPELAMEQEEGEQFMRAAQNVLRHYSVETTQKTLDWIAFGGVTLSLYGSRFGAYMIRKRNGTPQSAFAEQVAPVDDAPISQPQIVPDFE